jgi:hypothetical protein
LNNPTLIRLNCLPRPSKCAKYARENVNRLQCGLWLSLVERLVRDQEAVGSNPTSPIKTESAWVCGFYPL